MFDPADVLSEVCAAMDDRRPRMAAAILNARYPFVPLMNAGRSYSATQSMEVFVRDGFIDRYTGKRLVFPGALRLLSILLPDHFPFHNNWKTDACHFGYYELFPTIDHLIPVSRGGEDGEANWITTSMLKNAAKANFTMEELGWKLFPPGDLASWDGLTGWFMRYPVENDSRLDTNYLRVWKKAAVRVLA